MAKKKAGAEIRSAANSPEMAARHPHAPAPWTIGKDENGTVIRDAHGWSIAHMYGVWNNAHANEAVIVAAPDTTAALRALLDWARENTSPTDANSPHELLIAAAAALVKADGLVW
jgi:hypothetical protein